VSTELQNSGNFLCPVLRKSNFAAEWRAEQIGKIAEELILRASLTQLRASAKQLSHLPSQEFHNFTLNFFQRIAPETEDRAQKVNAS
jgi:hypothetical protein